MMPRATLPQPTTRTRGFSLVEAIIALMVLAVLVGTAVPVFTGFMEMNNRTEVRTGAVDAAEIALDALRREKPSTLPTGAAQQTATVTVAGRDYSVTTTFCPASTTFCDDVTRHLLTEVSYRGRQVYSVETVFTELR